MYARARFSTDPSAVMFACANVTMAVVAVILFIGRLLS